MCCPHPHGCVCGCQLECGCSAGSHVLKENRFPFPQKLSTVNNSLTGLSARDPHPHSGMWTCLILRRSCAGSHSCYKFMTIGPSLPEEMASSLTSELLTPRSFLLPLSGIFPELCGGWYDIVVSVMAECSADIYLLHLNQFSALIITHCTEKPL